jgi:hypothetical protein
MPKKRFGPEQILTLLLGFVPRFCPRSRSEPVLILGLPHVFNNRHNLAKSNEGPFVAEAINGEVAACYRPPNLRSGYAKGPCGGRYGKKFLDRRFLNMHWGSDRNAVG